MGYASILSGGLSKVKNVFKQKPKVEPATSDKESKSSNENETTEVQSEEVKVVLRNQEPSIHPDIPGLLFKKDMERRNSRKKRRSRLMDQSIESKRTLDECLPTNSEIDQSTTQSTDVGKNKSVMLKESKELQDGFVEVELLDSEKVEEHKIEDKPPLPPSTNTFKRRHSKKNKESFEQKFDNEIDQALHEIKMMEERAGQKTVEPLLKSSECEIKSKKRGLGSLSNLTKQKSEDSGNVADDEADNA